jgi:type I restriction enzyme R subunit
MLKDYKSFNKNDFDLVISDEAHRSISGEQRAVFEYFNGYKLGLTATPKNYLKNAKLDDNYDERQLRDTYNTFGCSVGEPTFRYTLEQGTKDGFLVQPWVIDCRTDITIELLSEDGYKFIKISEEDGEKKSIEVFYKKSDFERSFFSEETNKSFCKAFLDNAKRDPISDEIGKTIFFCVSQNHASKIANILNIMMGRSDFAIQVTSQVADSQEMTRKFTKDVNKLLGKSEKIKDYDTSKARVCCTVGMMTTGYDCEDLLNVVLCRPIMSPSEFIQIKGRGTRKTKFEHNDKIIEKDNFYLFDYFGNYIFFEKNFNYDKKLKLLKNEDRSLTTIIIYDKEEVENFKKDPIKTKSTIQIENSMRVDRETFGRIRDELNDKITMNIQDINDIKQYWETDKFDRPELYLNWEKLRELINVDYRASPQEIIENIVFNRDLPRADDLINNAFGNFIINKDINCDTKILRDFFELYLKEKCFRDIIDRKCYAKLNNTMSFTLTDLKKIENFIVPISDYVKDNFISDKFLGD